MESLNNINAQEESLDILEATSQRIDLTWNNVSVCAGKKELISNCNGQVRAGEVVGLLGPSGCGKTTLLSALTGTVANNLTFKGKVFFNKDLISLKHCQELMAFVSHENDNYADLTVYEALSWVSRLKNSESKLKNAVFKSLVAMGLWKHKDTIYRKLSGGQKLRVSMALCLAIDASIIVMDEPTTGLDSTTASKIILEISKMARQGKAIIVSIHQPSEGILKIFDKIMLMSKGKTIFLGSPEYAETYFNNLGMVQTDKKVNPADFYIRLVSLQRVSRKALQNSVERIKFLVEEWKKNSAPFQVENTDRIDFTIARNVIWPYLVTIFFQLRFNSLKNSIVPIAITEIIYFTQFTLHVLLADPNNADKSDDMLTYCLYFLSVPYDQICSYLFLIVTYKDKVIKDDTMNSVKDVRFFTNDLFPRFFMIYFVFRICVCCIRTYEFSAYYDNFKKEYRWKMYTATQFVAAFTFQKFPEIFISLLQPLIMILTVCSFLTALKYIPLHIIAILSSIWFNVCFECYNIFDEGNIKQNVISVINALFIGFFVLGCPIGYFLAFAQEDQYKDSFLRKVSNFINDYPIPKSTNVLVSDTSMTEIAKIYLYLIIMTGIIGLITVLSVKTNFKGSLGSRH
ncbi:hypothetical protein NUSPORA_02309 [Nucleospora cyclopteri]